MPRLYTDEDKRIHQFLWILLGVFWESRIDLNRIDDIVARYIRTLNRFGVEIELHRDPVSERYQDVSDAVSQGIYYGMIEIPDPHSSILIVRSNLSRVVRKLHTFSEEEYRKALLAAKIAFHRSLWGKMDKDLKPRVSSAAT